MKIGLVGEAPNDTTSLQNLLSRRYPKEKVEFVSLLKIQNGSTLDNSKTFRFLVIENRIHKPDIIVFIRDLDSILPNRPRKLERLMYFRKANKQVNYIGIFLLHIYEIEALILSDPKTFNDMYNAELGEYEDVMNVSEPKEVLMAASKKYSESDNAKIFEKLDLDKLLSCKYFKDFIEELDKKVQPKIE